MHIYVSSLVFQVLALGNTAWWFCLIIEGRSISGCWFWPNKNEKSFNYTLRKLSLNTRSCIICVYLCFEVLWYCCRILTRECIEYATVLDENGKCSNYCLVWFCFKFNDWVIHKINVPITCWYDSIVSEEQLTPIVVYLLLLS